MALKRIRVPEAVGDPKPTDGRALLAMIEELTKDIPPEVWAELPPDLSENFEEYAYGELAPKP